MKSSFFIFFIIITSLTLQHCGNANPAYTAVGKDFYRDTAGHLFILTSGIEPASATLWHPNPSEEFVVSEPYYRLVPNIDVESYSSLPTPNYYSKDKNQVYIEVSRSDGTSIFVLEEADADSFVGFGYTWGKDKNHVYERGIILEGLHPDSLVILDTLNKEHYENGLFLWVRDQQSLFHGFSKIDRVDMASLELLWDTTKEQSYVQDKNWIYEDAYLKTQRND